MTEGPSKKTRKRWSHLLRGQFGLRMLLILITLVAGLTWMLLQPWGEGIHPSAVGKVKPGMTFEEVKAELGEPEFDFHMNYISYRVKVPLFAKRDKFCVISFANDGVASIIVYQDEDLARWLDFDITNGLND